MPNLNSSAGEQGWTQYQKLVLAELERHDDRQNKFNDDLVALRLAQSQVTYEVTRLAKDLTTIVEDIKKGVEDIKRIKEDNNAQKLDYTAMKTKFGTLCTIAGMIGGGLLTAVLKIFLHV